VKVPAFGGSEADGADPVQAKVPSVKVAENPGGRPEVAPSVHWIAVADTTPTVAKPLPAGPQVAAPPNAQLLLGVSIVIEVIANAFVAGLVTFTVKAEAATP